MNVVIKNINGRDIFVNHDRIYILLGNGNGAMTVRLDEATEDELKFAVGPDCKVDCDLVTEFKKATKIAESAAEETTTDSTINELIKLPAAEFMELVEYAKRHNNTFPKYSKFESVINANDAYCSAIIKLTRFWSPEIEEKAFNVFYNRTSETVVKMLTVLQAASTAVRDSGGDMQTFYCLKEVVDAYMSTLF